MSFVTATARLWTSQLLFTGVETYPWISAFAWNFHTVLIAPGYLFTNADESFCSTNYLLIFNLMRGFMGAPIRTYASSDKISQYGVNRRLVCMLRYTYFPLHLICQILNLLWLGRLCFQNLFQKRMSNCVLNETSQPRLTIGKAGGRCSTTIVRATLLYFPRG